VASALGRNVAISLHGTNRTSDGEDGEGVVILITVYGN
jgi:hypothetical protein